MLHRYSGFTTTHGGVYGFRSIEEEDQFISNYKGGFVLLKTLGSSRFTRDLDALGLDLDKEQVATLVHAALALELDDGFWYGDVNGSRVTRTFLPLVAFNALRGRKVRVTRIGFPKARSLL